MKHALRFVRRRSAMPPLGLITVAALLPESWNLRLIDTNITPLSDADLKWADMAMISSMAVQRAAAMELVARCRASGVKTVAGGPLFSSEPDSFPEIDHLVLNEAEITLPPFLKDLAAGCAKHRYSSDQFCDLAQTPVPRWDLLDLRRYHLMGIQYSRGCPFNCDFCNVTSLFGRVPRVKTPEQIINELDSMVACGWRGNVFFVDDNLIGHRKAARTQLLPALQAWRGRRKRRVSFNTQASMNIADDSALLKQMSDAGFDQVFIGIETPDDAALEGCGKGQNRKRDLTADVKRIHRAGIEVQGGFILGFDSDNASIFDRQIDFIRRSGIPTAMVGMLQAVPGTGLYERMQREGRLTSGYHGDNVDGTTNLTPIMGMDVLRDGYEMVLRALYKPSAYYKRVRAFLREFRTHGTDSSFGRGIFAFLRSIVVLGIVDRGRLSYWKTLAWALLCRPLAFSRAVTLAITGYHIRRTCDEQFSAANASTVAPS